MRFLHPLCSLLLQCIRHHFLRISFCPLDLHFSSAPQSGPTLCDPVNCSTPGLPVHHQLPEFTQTHVHRVSDAIQPSHPLPSPSPPAPSPSQHQGLFQISLVFYFIHRINSVYKSLPIFQFIPSPFPPWYPYVCSLCLCLYFCFANKFICTIFLNSTYKQ